MVKKFLLVDSDVLPEVFLRVILAKELLTTNKAKNITQAAKMANISRSALYKYKDSVYDIGNSATAITLQLRLRDEPGALQAALSVLSHSKANVITINQATPQNGVADVSVMCNISNVTKTAEEILAELGRLQVVIEVHQIMQETGNTISWGGE